ncbi:MAG: glycosyltransferase family 4 protein [Saprospiraceae bacterium]
MRIAVNTRFLLKDKLEGIGWVSYELLRRMVAAHPEDEFLFFFDRAYAPEFIFGDNVQAIVLAPPARHPILWFLWFEVALVRALKKYRAEVFLSPDGYCSLRTPTKTVMITHDLAHLHFPDHIPFLVKKYYNYFVPRYLQRAEQIVSVSEFTKQDIIRQYKIAPAKIQVIPNACRADFIPLESSEQEQVRAEYTGGQPYFFYLGAVHPRKNVPKLIKAFDQFKKQNLSTTRLLIGGRFAWQTGLVKTAYEAATHQADIQFLGYLKDEEAARLMASTRCFIYISAFEGFGLPVLEAINCEVPVICSQVSSLPEVAGEAAILVDPYDLTAIADAMQRLSSEAPLREALITQAKQQKLQFSWERSAAQLYDLLSRQVKS